MQITKVCCQGCGANLEVDESIRFVTCRQCRTALEVVHGERTVHTVVAGPQSGKVAVVAQEVEVLKLENQLLRIDGEWEIRKRGLMLHDRYGRAYQPGTPECFLPAVLLTLCGAIALLFGTKDQGLLIGLLFVPIGIGLWFYQRGKAEDFNRAFKAHQTRRMQIISEINQRRKDSPELLRHLRMRVGVNQSQPLSLTGRIKKVMSIRGNQVANQDPLKRTPPDDSPPDAKETHSSSKSRL